jgi:CheY-like chemotaxis protein
VKNVKLVVVYADDDQLVRDVVAASLEFEGCTVHACSDGDQAVILCAETQPDAVLLDLNMPNVDGFEAALRLRAGSECHPARIVAITGKATEQNVTHARSSGFDAVLTKPFKIGALLDALRPR